MSRRYDSVKHPGCTLTRRAPNRVTAACSPARTGHATLPCAMPRQTRHILRHGRGVAALRTHARDQGGRRRTSARGPPPAALKAHTCCAKVSGQLQHGRPGCNWMPSAPSRRPHTQHTHTCTPTSTPSPQSSHACTPSPLRKKATRQDVKARRRAEHDNPTPADTPANQPHANTLPGTRHTALRQGT